MSKTSNDEKTISVPEAGKRYYGLSPTSSWAAAKRGDIPTIRVGKLIRVPLVAMERIMENAGNSYAATKLDEAAA
jgi:hypothetical protein